MSEYTSDAIRQTGEIRDALGRSLFTGSDCDAVVIWVPGNDPIYLDVPQRVELLRCLYDADRHARHWAREHPAAAS